MSVTTTKASMAVDRYLQVGGLRVHVRETGHPDAPPVLLLHGLMGHAREWDSLVEVLASRFRIIAVDQRGHGETDHADGYTAEVMAGDVVGILDALDIPRTHFVAHSMGGIIATLVAARFPHLVDRFVLIDVGPDSLTTEWGITQLPIVLRTFAESVYDDVEEAVHEWLSGDPLAREPLLRHYVEHCLVPRPDGRLGWCFDARKLGQFGTSVSGAELWDAIGRITAPTLLIRGEHSHLLSPESAQTMVRRLRRGSFAQIARGGHDLGVQQPEAVARAAFGFLTA